MGFSFSLLLIAVACRWSGFLGRFLFGPLSIPLTDNVLLIRLNVLADVEERIVGMPMGRDVLDQHRPIFLPRTGFALETIRVRWELSCANQHRGQVGIDGRVEFGFQRRFTDALQEALFGFAAW